MFKLLSVRQFLPALARNIACQFLSLHPTRTATCTPTHACTFYFMTDFCLTPEGSLTDTQWSPDGALMEPQWILNGPQLL